MRNWRNSRLDEKRRDLRAGMAEIYPVDLKWEYAVARGWLKSTLWT